MKNKLQIKGLRNKLGWLLCLVAFLVCAQGAWADDTYPGKTTVFVKVPSSWTSGSSKVSLHQWDNGSGTSWPGDQMQKVATVDAIDYYMVTTINDGFKKYILTKTDSDNNHTKRYDCDASVSRESGTNCIDATATATESDKCKYSWTNYEPSDLYIRGTLMDCSWKDATQSSSYRQFTKNGSTYTVKFGGCSSSNDGKFVITTGVGESYRLSNSLFSCGSNLSKDSNNNWNFKSDLSYDASKVYVLTITWEAGGSPSMSIAQETKTYSYYLSGFSSPWTDTELKGSSDELKCTKKLSSSTTYSGDTGFKIKITDNGGGITWLGNNGTMSGTNCSGWTMKTSDNNCGITTVAPGDYVFSFNKSNNKLSVTYPYGIYGNFSGSWTLHPLTDGAATINNITKSTTAYEFQVATDNWYGNTGTYQRANSGQAWTFTSGADNCKMIPDETGNYTFSWNQTDKKLTITYPAPTCTNPTSVAISGTNELDLNAPTVTTELTATPTGGHGTFVYAWSVVYDPDGGATFKGSTTGTSTLSLTKIGTYQVKVTAKCADAAEAVSSSNYQITVSKGSTTYYIKHPWKDGQEGSWSWQQMTVSDTECAWTYEGYYGNSTFDINTSASDDGKVNYTPTLYGTPQMGDYCSFKFIPATAGSRSGGTASVTKLCTPPTAESFTYTASTPYTGVGRSADVKWKSSGAATSITTYYKVKGADDNTYSTTLPVNAGNYTVAVTTDAAVGDFCKVTSKLKVGYFEIKKIDQTSAVNITNPTKTGCVGEQITLAASGGDVSPVTYTFTVVDGGSGSGEIVDSNKLQGNVKGTVKVVATNPGNDNYNAKDSDPVDFTFSAHTFSGKIYIKNFKYNSTDLWINNDMPYAWAYLWNTGDDAVSVKLTLVEGVAKTENAVYAGDVKGDYAHVIFTRNATDESGPFVGTKEQTDNIVLACNDWNRYYGFTVSGTTTSGDVYTPCTNPTASDFSFDCSAVEYDNTDKPVAVSWASTPGGGAITTYYKTGSGAYGETAPKNAGTYSVAVKSAKGGGFCATTDFVELCNDYKINRASRTITVAQPSATQYCRTATPTASAAADKGDSDGTKSYAIVTTEPGKGTGEATIDSSTGVITCTKAGTVNVTATISGGANYAYATSDPVTFTFVAETSVTTGDATSITPHTATLPGSFTGGLGTPAVGIKMGDTSYSATSAAGSNFSLAATNLKSNTQYTYQAYVTDDCGTTYGTEKSFTTSMAYYIIGQAAPTDGWTQMDEGTTYVYYAPLSRIESANAKWVKFSDIDGAYDDAWYMKFSIDGDQCSGVELTGDLSDNQNIMAKLASSSHQASTAKLFINVNTKKVWATATSTCIAPEITAYQLSGATYLQGATATALSVTATNALGYQWYSSADGSTDWTVVSGATNAIYSPATASIGTTYYKCIVSGCESTSAESYVSGAIVVNRDQTKLRYSPDSSGDTWTEYDMTYDDVNGVYTYEFTADAVVENGRFQIKKVGANKLYGNDNQNKMVRDNCSNWNVNTENYVTYVNLDAKGKYTFTYNRTTNKVSIAYPYVIHIQLDGTNWSDYTLVDGSVSIPMVQGTTRAFKVATTGWYGNSGTMTRDNCTGWTFESSKGDAHITADRTGNYVFNWDEGQRKLSVSYPCDAPVITTDLNPSTTAQSVCYGGKLNSIAIAAEGINVTYQWYKKVAGSADAPVLIDYAVSPEYVPSNKAVGSYVYQCVVTACGQNVASQFSGAINVSETITPVIGGPTETTQYKPEVYTSTVNNTTWSLTTNPSDKGYLSVDSSTPASSVTFKAASDATKFVITAKNTNDCVSTIEVKVNQDEEDCGE